MHEGKGKLSQTQEVALLCLLLWFCYEIRPATYQVMQQRLVRSRSHSG